MIAVTDWAQGMAAECSEMNGFHMPTVVCVNAESVCQNDLLLLTIKKVMTFSLLSCCLLVIFNFKLLCTSFYNNYHNFFPFSIARFYVNFFFLKKKV